MALDRQRILSELGNVVKQLQSADCGCMGKIFSNPSQSPDQAMWRSPPTWGGCRHVCSHGAGYGHNYNFKPPCTTSNFQPTNENEKMKLNLCEEACNENTELSNELDNENIGGYTNNHVKPSMSKTCLVGKKPVGKTPSRSQLQRIYNQYKGSQSFTQQNIPPIQAATYPDDKSNLPIKEINEEKKILIENVAGDSIANNRAPNIETIKETEKVMGRFGDMPEPKAGRDDVTPGQIPVSKQMKCRNGLQDVVYTSYSSSTAWSFHGNPQTAYFTGQRSRRKA